MGWDPERILDNSRDLDCIVCREILKDAVMCVDCQCSFCVDCGVQNQNICPQCRSENVAQPNLFARRLVDKLVMTCVNKQEGCDMTFTTDCETFHSCAYTSVICPNLGCTERYLRKNKHLHLCAFISLVCPDCSYKYFAHETHSCMTCILSELASHTNIIRTLTEENAQLKIKFSELHRRFQDKIICPEDLRRLRTRLKREHSLYVEADALELTESINLRSATYPHEFCDAIINFIDPTLYTPTLLVHNIKCVSMIYTDMLEFIDDIQIQIKAIATLRELLKYVPINEDVYTQIEGNSGLIHLADLYVQFQELPDNITNLTNITWIIMRLAKESFFTTCQMMNIITSPLFRKHVSSSTIHMVCIHELTILEKGCALIPHYAYGHLMAALVCVKALRYMELVFQIIFFIFGEYTKLCTSDKIELQEIDNIVKFICTVMHEYPDDATLQLLGCKILNKQDISILNETHGDICFNVLTRFPEDTLLTGKACRILSRVLKDPKYIIKFFDMAGLDLILKCIRQGYAHTSVYDVLLCLLNNFAQKMNLKDVLIVVTSNINTSNLDMDRKLDIIELIFTVEPALPVDVLRDSLYRISGIFQNVRDGDCVSRYCTCIAHLLSIPELHDDFIISDTALHLIRALDIVYSSDAKYDIICTLYKLQGTLNIDLTDSKPSIQSTAIELTQTYSSLILINDKDVVLKGRISTLVSIMYANL